ncbi:MAG: tRNA-dihydrouridine synthase [Candidatus Lambdaproteobacteria bacterium]|nr:tRNA-dihydrouridine synthase [Candidatus Lambdaproteobacteria bacterium]
MNWSELPRPIVCLAPMDGITDSAYRRIVREVSRETILFSEFTSADGYLRSDKIRRRLDYRPEEHPYFVQLFGNNPDAFAETARALEQAGVAGIDINMGCPARKIVASQHGSGLMQDVKLACRIVGAVARAVPLPVSVKTRLGWHDARDLPEFAGALADAGAALITIHGRTYDQAFHGEADWAPIYALKRRLAVPVLGNGDVADVADGLRRMGPLDGFMIGRAAIGNPWAFRPGPAAPPDTVERLDVVRRHYAYAREARAERHALIEFRKHLAAYLRGFTGAKAARVRLMRMESEAEFLAALDELAHRAPPLAKAG